MVKFGSTRQVTARVITVARAAPAPSALKCVVPYLTAPTSRQSPTMPLQVIITAAKTVSRASVEVSLPPAEHQREDQRHLDDGDRHGEHQRAERLADPEGDHLGVVHRGEHGAGEEQRDHVSPTVPGCGPR